MIDTLPFAATTCDLKRRNTGEDNGRVMIDTQP